MDRTPNPAFDRLMSQTLAELRRCGRHDDFSRLLGVVSQRTRDMSSPAWDTHMAIMCHQLENGDRSMAELICRAMPYGRLPHDARRPRRLRLSPPKTFTLHHFPCTTRFDDGWAHSAVRQAVADDHAGCRARSRNDYPITENGTMAAVAVAHSRHPENAGQRLSDGGLVSEWIVALCGVLGDCEAAGVIAGPHMGSLIPRNSPHSPDRRALAGALLRSGKSWRMRQAVAGWLLEELACEEYADNNSHTSRILTGMAARSPMSPHEGPRKRPESVANILVRRYRRQSAATADSRGHARSGEPYRRSPEELLCLALLNSRWSPEDCERAIARRRSCGATVPAQMALYSAVCLRRHRRRVEGIIREALEEAVSRAVPDSSRRGHGSLLADAADALYEDPQADWLVDGLGACAETRRAARSSLEDHLRATIGLATADRDAGNDAMRRMCLERDDWAAAATACSIFRLEPMVSLDGVLPKRHGSLTARQLVSLADPSTISPQAFAQHCSLRTSCLWETDPRRLKAHETAELRIARQAIADAVLSKESLSESVLELMERSLTASGERHWSTWTRFLQDFYDLPGPREDAT